MAISSILKLLFGSRNDRILKKMKKTVKQINDLEKSFTSLSDDELKAKTEEFKNRFLKGESLEDLLPEAFAAAREAAHRTLGMRHFDVQLIGGIILHRGKIAEMCTGEGKTLVATLPAYLNALTGHGVHVVTVNDYLAKRDADWMEPVYKALGLTVGVVVPDLSLDKKQEAYACDIVYANNNELGFDYLRDRMAYNKEQCVQGKLFYAIVDEVDSILIDEARTPLIISGAVEDSSSLYKIMNSLVPGLVKQQEEDGPGDYFIDEKTRQVFLTEEGHTTVENMLLREGLLNNGQSLYHVSNSPLLHHINAAIRAHAIYQRNVDYIVKDNQIMIIDEHTGRTMEGRRWSEGLHQAVEAKEGVEIQQESQTLASISYQNFFRLYSKLAGMTGTADTEAYEFHQIYDLEVVVAPTNKKIARDDRCDLIFITDEEKYEAVIEDIKDCVERKQPVLVGTISIENSENISNLLKKHKIKHEVLNAKNHAKEADIVALAGMPGAVTIATNMAGRGTDIVLGGNLKNELSKLSDDVSEEEKEKLRLDWEERNNKVKEVGGLHVIGTERHESRRIDNQLRGRSGRQGDPGSSQFYISFNDPLMRRFASDRTKALMRTLGTEQGESLSHPWLNSSIEGAQRRVEGKNFDARKHMLEFDNISNEQRTIIYKQRDELMGSSDLSENIKDIIYDVFSDLCKIHMPIEQMSETWNVEELEKTLELEFLIDVKLQDYLANNPNASPEELEDLVHKAANESYNKKVEMVEPEVMRDFEKSVMLHSLDLHWREHLATMDSLRQGIGLRSYAQKDPRQEYKREAFILFSEMLDSIKHDAVGILFRTQLRSQSDLDMAEESRRKDTQASELNYQQNEAQALLGEDNKSEFKKVAPLRREGKKVGRNDPCPCGSGKKYKNCHGSLS